MNTMIERHKRKTSRSRRPGQKGTTRKTLKKRKKMSDILVYFKLMSVLKGW